jgi:hypothetical protein
MPRFRIRTDGCGIHDRAAITGFQMTDGIAHGSRYHAALFISVRYLTFIPVIAQQKARR